MKPIFLFITTFVLAIVLAFFSSYFIVQKVQGTGGIVGFGADIDMSGYKIKNVAVGTDSFDGVPLIQFEGVDALCLRSGGAAGDQPYCILSWCDINDFSFCGTQDSFYPYGEPAPSCFTAQTPILMADGKSKNIADVQPGEYVLTRESENSSKLVKAKVLEVYEHLVNRYLIINDLLEVTREHRMFVNEEWKVAGKIKLGDKLLNKDNQEIVVESIEEVAKKENLKVYNLEIEKYKTYFANGFYVHNVKPQY